MEKIPYGISNFKKLRENDYFYIDKTGYIEQLESYGEPYIFFLRPRRFGKSLFISLLDTYYDFKNKDSFDDYFKGLYIGDKKTPLASSYYILKFNFSGINTSNRDSLLEGFTAKVKEGLKKFAERYELKLSYENTGMPSDIFNSFITSIAYSLENKVYVLVDEYDHFANELLSFQVDTFEETVSKTGFVRKWYEILKEATEIGIVDRIFGTGVSPVTLDSLTSGFNIAKNKTRSKELNKMMGFTEEEVLDLLERTTNNDINVNEVMPALKNYYNGYLFNEDAEEKVFNSDMVLYYISEYLVNKEPPVDLIDTNISSDYAKMQKLFTLKNKERNYTILEEILEGKLQKTTITREYSLAKEFTKDDFRSLLFYLGFLTIKGRVLNRVKIGIPNYVIKELYFDFFAEIVRKEAEYELDTADIKDSIEQIAIEGDIDEFVQIIEKTLKKVSFRDFIKFNEKYVKLIMLSYLMLSKVYYVKSEYEVEDGYIDIALFERSGLSLEYEALIEVKYIKKQDYEEKGKVIVEEKSKEGKDQIIRYRQTREFKNKDKLKKWVLVFAGDKCVAKMEVDNFEIDRGYDKSN